MSSAHAVFRRAIVGASERAAIRSDDPAAEAWRTGDLRHKLQAHQLPIFDAILAWMADPPDSAALGALYDSVFVIDIARRFGKTTLCLILLYIWAITLPKLIGRGAILTYATREKDQIKRIVLPIHRMLTADAPRDLAPQHYGSHEGMGEGLYFPQSVGGSIVKLVGVDKDPHRLRGEGSDGGVFSEAGHMKDLKENVTSVFLPQFQQRPWARLILESTAPEEIDHDFDMWFVPDAKLRGAYVFGTLDDNTTLTQADRDKALREAGGPDSPVAKREYYGLRIRDPESTAVPEYDEARHVGQVDRPPYALSFVFQDPGIRDLFGIVWAYWHFELSMLVCQRSWAKRNAGTAEIAAVIAATNEELWGGEQPLKWWDGPVERQNPALNVSDIDARLIHDLNSEYDMRVRPADKSRSTHGVGEAKLYKLRNAFLERRPQDDGSELPRIMIAADDPGPLRDHLRKAAWNESRTDLARHATFGHYDCMMALVYGWTAIQHYRNRNPNKPQLVSRLDQGKVFGPKYKPPMTRQDTINAAFQAGLSRANRGGFARCPVCGKRRRCDVFMNGQLVCSQDCYNAWVYRNTGGKPPAETG